MAAVLIPACTFARQPPFTLGSEVRVAEIRKTFKAETLPSSMVKAGSDKLTLHTQSYPPGSTVRGRRVFMAGSEIVAEDILFMAPGEKPLTAHETVRSTVPWASAWAETTIQQLKLADLSYHDVPLYTATQSGWIAKLYASEGAARLVVLKVGIPGLDVDDLVHTHAQPPKGVQEVMEMMKAARKEKAAKVKQ